MSTSLQRVTEEAFVRFNEAAIADYAEVNVACGRWPVEGALERSRLERARLLPQGLATPGQHPFTFHDDTSSTAVGALWSSVTEHPDGRTGHVDDVAIDPPHRRRGHARAAFLALEAVHVLAHNERAQALYRALGHEPTGINTRRSLPP